MENITLGQILGFITFLVAFVGAISTLFIYAKKGLKSLLKDELRPIENAVQKNNELIVAVDINSTKNYLSKCFNDIRQGQQLSETNIQRIYEQIEHYEKMGGNSYIHKEFEDLKKEGLL